jgi:hypothetical protein
MVDIVISGGRRLLLDYPGEQIMRLKIIGTPTSRKNSLRWELIPLPMNL